MILFLDFETTFQTDEKKRTDPSPYIKENYLVSVGYAQEKLTSTASDDPEVSYGFFKHNTARVTPKETYKDLQEALNKTTLLVAHNVKFELAWLRSCGFKYEGKVACTQIREYVLAKGQKLGVSLEDSCIRNNLTHKKSDLVQGFLNRGIGFETIDEDIVREYGVGDIYSCRDLYYNQLERLGTTLVEGIEVNNEGLWPTINLMEEFCRCLVEIEENGIKIDLVELDRLELEYLTKLNSLKNDLQLIVEQVMGATPINLDSPQQLSELIYSRRVIDKKAWKKLFNLGSEIRGSVRKIKYTKKYSTKDFINIVRENTEVLYKTTAEHCDACKGNGRLQRTLKDNTLSTKEYRCKDCGGAGYTLTQNKEIAGLRCVPESSITTAVGGFSTDKGTLEALSNKARGVAKEFLTKITEISKISNYLDTFIGGIRRGLRDDGILHTQFMQCVTATGRLSSRNPNFQNIPRGSSFPVKKAIVSRWASGSIMSSDARQLEFRIAGELSGDEQIFKDVLDGVDVHEVTSEHTGFNRQDSKPHTFAPVYGASEHGKPPNIANYYVHFKKKYHQHDEWKTDSCNSVITNRGYYKLPSGREYYFPNVRRLPNGNITNSTIIANYPVQGFATADLVPIATINIWKLFKQYNLNSIIILEVHDDVTADVFPGEEQIVCELMKQGWGTIKDECLRRYKYDLKIPIEIEIKTGPNWLEQKQIY